MRVRLRHRYALRGQWAIGFRLSQHAALLCVERQLIYLRYGGRDAESTDRYLKLQSLELALERGLQPHEQHLQGELAAPSRLSSLFPRNIAVLARRTSDRNRSVECHLIADDCDIKRQ